MRYSSYLERAGLSARTRFRCAALTIACLCSLAVACTGASSAEATERAIQAALETDVAALRAGDWEAYRASVAAECWDEAGTDVELQQFADDFAQDYGSSEFEILVTLVRMESPGRAFVDVQIVADTVALPVEDSILFVWQDDRWRDASHCVFYGTSGAATAEG